MTTTATATEKARHRPVLVTGAAGFVGSHLCDRLLQAGHRVVGLDNLSTGDMDHLAHLREEPGFSFVRHDIGEPLPLTLSGMSFGRIFNLACPASPAYRQQHPVQTVLASALGTWRLLELARQQQARLLQVSTSEVYGDPQVHPQTEACWGHVNPVGPRACHGEGTRCAEAMCAAYAAQHGVDIRIARLFNSYGPRLRPGDGRVVSNFIVQALAGRPLTVYGDGLQTRSFCYVSDTVAGLLALMDSAVTVPVNLGNPREITVLELARQVLEMTGSSAGLSFRPLPPDDPVRRCPDIARARSALHWEPKVSQHEGLLRTIHYFRALLILGRTAEPLRSVPALAGADKPAAKLTQGSRARATRPRAAAS